MRNYYNCNTGNLVYVSFLYVFLCSTLISVLLLVSCIVICGDTSFSLLKIWGTDKLQWKYNLLAQCFGWLDKVKYRCEGLTVTYSLYHNFTLKINVTMQAVTSESFRKHFYSFNSYAKLLLIFQLLPVLLYWIAITCILFL